MMIAMRGFAFVAVVLLCASRAYADQTTAGILVNGTTGDHIESDRTQSVPFLPLPIIELDHAHKHLLVHLEGMPPIGPVPLAQSDPYAGAQDPRVSYLDGDLLYAMPDRPLAFGIGETVLNQRTLNQSASGGASNLQFSRVVGVRYIGRGTLYAFAQDRLEATVAVNPAMNGLLDGRYAEYASLFDGSLRLSHPLGRYQLLYGMRYMNYTAGYRVDHALADRNHLLMPFIGIEYYGKRRAPVETVIPRLDSSALKRRPRPMHAATIGFTLLGTNGNRTSTGAYSDTPLSFALAPMVSFDDRVKTFELEAQAMLPNANANPFGTSINTRWSDLSVDGLTHLRASRFALGLGETVTNLEPARPSPYVNAHTRSEALDLVGRYVVAEDFHSRLELQVRVNPYVHVTSISSDAFPGQPLRSFTTIAHGARFDAALVRTTALGRFSLSCGLRYINQTTNYGSFGTAGLDLTRSSSMMPFAGVSIHP